MVAAASHSLKDIQDTAINYVRLKFTADAVDIRISAKHLDARLRLPQCQSPLEASFPHANRQTTGNTLVAVGCNGPKPWSIYVPVTIQIYRDILVASQSLPQRRILTNNDIQMERLDINRYTGAYITDPDLIVGKQLIRPVQIGRPILANMLKEPLLIRRGELVTLLAKTQTYEVRMAGKALMDGASGDRIRVRNLRSKRIIEGNVARNGTVYVDQNNW